MDDCYRFEAPCSNSRTVEGGSVMDRMVEGGPVLNRLLVETSVGHAWAVVIKRRFVLI